MSNNLRQAVPNKKIGTAEPHSIEEVAWRDVWLKRVLIDRGNPSPTSDQTDDQATLCPADMECIATPVRDKLWKPCAPSLLRDGPNL